MDAVPFAEAVGAPVAVEVSDTTILVPRGYECEHQRALHEDPAEVEEICKDALTNNVVNLRTPACHDPRVLTAILQSKTVECANANDEASTDFLMFILSAAPRIQFVSFTGSAKVSAFVAKDTQCKGLVVKGPCPGLEDAILLNSTITSLWVDVEEDEAGKARWRVVKRARPHLREIFVMGPKCNQEVDSAAPIVVFY